MIRSKIGLHIGGVLGYFFKGSGIIVELYKISFLKDKVLVITCFCWRCFIFTYVKEVFVCFIDFIGFIVIYTWVYSLLEDFFNFWVCQFEVSANWALGCITSRGFRFRLITHSVIVSFKANLNHSRLFITITSKYPPNPCPTLQNCHY